MSGDFEGFSPELFGFLAELSVNNERDWFQANKQRYEDHVREPARAFVRAVGPRLQKLSGHFVASDKQVGGSLMRIFRDVRFSKDKSPYKTNVGIQFRHARGKDVHAPGYYLHLDLNECFIGVGMWHPDSPSLKAIRERIVAEPDLWRTVTGDSKLTEHFRHAGDSLSRAPRGFDKDHPLVDDLKRKDHILVCDVDPDDVLGPDAVDFVMDRFARCNDFMRFLAGAIDVEF